MSRRSTPTPYYDAAWIIALWRALHGGDPTPEDVAAEVIAGLSRILPGGERSFLSWELQSPCALGASKLGVSKCEHPEPLAADPNNVDPTELDDVDPDQPEYSIHHYYFKFKGQRFCLDLPALTHSPTAA